MSLFLIIPLFLILLGLFWSLYVSAKYSTEIKKEQRLPPLKYREELTNTLLTGAKYYASVYTNNNGMKVTYEAWLAYKNKRFEVTVLLKGEPLQVVSENSIDELIARLPYQTKFTISDFRVSS